MANKEEKQITIDGVLFSVHPKTAKVDGEKLTLGFSHLPVPPTDGDDDAFGDWLAEMVSCGVLTWKQIATGLYGIVLQQHGKILREYTDAIGGKEPSVDYLMQTYYERAREAIGDDAKYGVILATCKKMHNDDVKDGKSAWDAEEHRMFPRDVR